MGLIPDEIISQVLDRCDIVETISEYLSLKKAGRNFKACCPFHHEKTPSFVVNRDKQIFHCFGCGAGGNVISFVMQHDRIDFPTALRQLAQRAGIIIPETHSEAGSKTKSIRETVFKSNELAADFFHNILLTGDKGADQAKEYLKKRGVRLETAQKLKIGFAPDGWENLISFLRSKEISLLEMEKSGLVVSKERGEGFYDRFRNRVIFPIFDIRCRCVGFGARAMEENATAKYINSPETPVYVKGEHLYGFYLSKNAVAKEDYVVVVEGYMDFLTPFQEGFENIVASLGTALTTEQIRLIRRYTENIVMLFDGDDAGELAMLRSLDLLIEEGINVKVVSLEGKKDPDSFVREFGIEKFREQVLCADTLFDYKMNVLSRRYDKQTVEGKARISAEMLSTIQKFKNEVIKQEYVKKLAQRLGVSQNALLIELGKIKGSSSGEIEVVKKKAQKESIRGAERNLLRLLLEQEHMIPSVLAEVEIDDFQDDQVRPIIEQIFDLSKTQKDFNVAKLVHFFDDQETTHFISGLMASSDFESADKEVLKKDYINRIKNDRVKTQRKDLCFQIQQAEADGDHQRLEELKRVFNQLMKRS
ncbi:MAG: DNA primase [Candidatus Omnitrophica bacterium]|nr:DNA primase [Candidatus Omnitrophota bacterium]